MTLYRGPFPTKADAEKSIKGYRNPLCDYHIEERGDGWVVAVNQVRFSKPTPYGYRDSSRYVTYDNDQDDEAGPVRGGEAEGDWDWSDYQSSDDR